MDFEFKKCTENDIDRILEIQDEAFSLINDREILRRNSKEMLLSCLKYPHYTLGAFYEGKLVAFAILYSGEFTEENLGYDLGLEGEALMTVANVKLVIVSPEYRGNGLQVKLTEKLETEAKIRGFRILAATISPVNKYSIKNFEKSGYEFTLEKVKYDGLLRHIYTKTI